MNNDSDWLVKEARKDPGFHLNLNVRRIQFIKKSPMLNRKTTTPIILNQSDRYGTAGVSEEKFGLLGIIT
jgi:hypothetical protein